MAVEVDGLFRGPGIRHQFSFQAGDLTLLCFPLAVLVIFNHYLAFQYFAEEYYLFSEVRDRREGVDPCSCSRRGAAGGRGGRGKCHLFGQR